jgi:DNA-binding FadR family transcriptional regulator
MTQVQGEISDLFARLPTDLVSRKRALDQHREVAAAVVDGDAERARAAMRTHLEYVEQLLGERLG